MRAEAEVASMRIALATLALGLCLVQSATAEVFKCVADGKVVYSDSPCPDGKGSVISVRPVSQTESAYGPYSGGMRAKVAPMVGMKRSEPARSLDGQFEDKSYDIPAEGGYLSQGGRTIYTGPRGGQYAITSGGNKSYVRRR